MHVRTGKDRVTGDPRVREAIDLAIDRNAIVQQVLEGHGGATRGFFPPAIPGFAPELSRDIRFDPERAKALLREAGYSDRKRPAIKISTPSGRYVKDREIVEAVAGYLEDVGFQVQVEVLDWTVYNNKVVGDGFGELYLWGMGSYTDASTLFVDNFKRHYDWSDETFDGLAPPCAREERGRAHRDLAEGPADRRRRTCPHRPALPAIDLRRQRPRHL